MFLAGTMILPGGVSYAQTSNVTATSPGVTTASNQTMAMPMNHTSGGANQTMSNKTMAMPMNVTASTNQTAASANFTASQNATDTIAVQQVSSFIHQAAADFKQQGVETRQAMLDCRDKLQSASPNDVQSIRDVCTTNLSAIKAKYQDERNHYHDLVKQYRQSVIVFLDDARGLSVSKAKMDDAFAKLSIMMHMAMASGAMGTTNAMNSTH